jgi:hypothetical protein
MKSVKQILSLRRLSIAVASSALAACGAGGDQAHDSAATQTAATFSSSATGVRAAGALTGPITTTVPVSAPPTNTTTASVSTTGITNVRFENTSTTVTQSNVPVTFGQIFAKGDLQATDKLSGRLDDGTTVPLQVDVKATHADGSIRHAIISAIVPSIAAAKERTMSLVKGGTAPTGSTTVDTLMKTGFSVSVHAKVGGVDYYASADDLLKTTKPTAWLNGPIATEWQVSAPLRTASGAVHPHLSARFAIRWYPGASKARADVVVENDWAYEPSPQNFTYDASVIVGGTTVYSKASMTHYHHARWRKLFWVNGTEPQVNVKEDTDYLIKSLALPNYDRSLVVPESSLAALQTKWTGAITEPMAVGMADKYMPGTGGRDDIGLMPGWTVEYLLSMDKRAKAVTMGTADLSGSWSSHYRDRNTDRPISLMDHPYMTILGQQADTMNPATKQYEAFPKCATTTACTTPNTHDSAHQANFAYLPYMVTGDYYYLEELQFWTMWNLFSSNPNYRQSKKGLFNPDQVRGQAWSMRTLSEAAYITPDSDALKAQFTTWLSNNLDWYNTTYTQNPSANVFGVITNGAFVYSNGTGLAAWQDDFFTSAIGHAVDLGFEKAQPLLAWKAKYPNQRMLDAQTCWIDAALYSMVARDSATSPLYTTWAQVSKASRTSTFNSLQCGSAAMASFLKLQVGEMTGYSTSPMGYPSNMQPALAYSAGVSATGKTAWTKFMGRAVKPDYRSSPQFAIVPR